MLCVHTESFHLTPNDHPQSTSLSASLQNSIVVSQRCKTEEVQCKRSTTSHSKLYPVIPGCRIITIFHLSLLFSFSFIGSLMPFLWSASGGRPVLTHGFVEAALFSLLLYLHFCPVFLQNRVLVFHQGTSCPKNVCCYRSVGDLLFGFFRSANFHTF